MLDRHCFFCHIWSQARRTPGLHNCFLEETKQQDRRSATRWGQPISGVSVGRTVPTPVAWFLGLPDLEPWHGEGAASAVDFSNGNVEWSSLNSKWQYQSPWYLEAQNRRGLAAGLLHGQSFFLLLLDVFASTIVEACLWLEGNQHSSVNPCQCQPLNSELIFQPVRNIDMMRRVLPPLS